MKCTRWIRIALVTIALAFVIPVIAFAQGEPPAEPSVDWNEIIALAINSVLVFTIVQLIKTYAHELSGTTKQILALAGGPLLMMFAQPALSGALGYPIDFSPIANALGGLISSAVAMAAFDTAKLAGGK